MHVSDILRELPESEEHLYAEKLLSSYVLTGETVTVLLADDHEVLRQSLGALMHGQPDIELIGEASDGEEVVRLARELKPDVVVMDVAMPRLDGVEATRQILEAVPDVRVIGLSMHDDPGMAAAMKNAGAYAYVYKTSPVSLLLDLIRNAARVTNP
jgi:DNA-binding NarL/FixJ family response regulator